MTDERIKVTIRCNRCGEKYTLRGKKFKDRIDTGFKQCLCDNTTDLHIAEKYE